jgi:hypothetical protein
MRDEERLVAIGRRHHGALREKQYRQLYLPIAIIWAQSFAEVQRNETNRHSIGKI